MMLKANASPSPLLSLQGEDKQATEQCKFAIKGGRLCGLYSAVAETDRASFAFEQPTILTLPSGEGRGEGLCSTVRYGLLRQSPLRRPGDSMNNSKCSILIAQ